MVSIIFLPLYFTLSGLSTDLGLLNNGKNPLYRKAPTRFSSYIFKGMTWGYTIAICVVAFTAKFGGCSLAARFAAGFNWREASTIGSLMSCKG
jgi:Kef-type K+ transport system membrane component KefB